MRISTIQHRRHFYRGSIAGLVLVIVKFFLYLPVDLADILYGVAILITIVITAGELLEIKYFVLEARVLDFVLGFLFPLDCYAVLILFGVPLTS